jgi:PAS domain S-box-containing protein
VTDADLEQRVLLLAPTTKDAALTGALLRRAGVECAPCPDLAQLCRQLEAGAGAVLLPEEAVAQERKGPLVEWLARQPPWSDLPVLVLARPGADSAAVAQAMDLLGNVTVLERPTRVAALVSAVRTALRARQRQYQARAHLAERERGERELRDFFDNAAIGLHWAGPDGIILRANQTELDMLGYTREEYVGRHIAELHIDREVIEDILQRLTGGETIREQAARLRCKDGSIKHVLINSNVLWEGGRFVHTRCFTRDVSDRKEAERAQALLAAIVASSEDAIISKTMAGTILSWNAGAERLFGYSAAEAVGQPITMLIPPERHDEELAILRRLGAGERIEHFETVRVTKDGRRLDISLSVSPVRDGEGRIVAASKVARDVSQRKQAEEALRAAREQLEVVTDNMAAAVARCSRDLRFLWVSRGCAAWLDRPAEDVVGRSIPDVLGAAAYETIRPHIERVLAGERVTFTARVPYASLGPRWVNAVYVPTRDRFGMTDGWVAVITDITAHRELEEALREADRRKDEFLAILAHELRNPLAPIRNSLHVLCLAIRDDPATRGVGEIIERQVNHMVRLVDDLLEVSRITRGKIELRKERVEVADVVRNAVETSRPLIEEARHELTVTVPPGPLPLEGDPVRLAQVFANLLNNAAKYTEEGGRIWLTVRREGGEVVILVRDNGTGMPAEMLPRIFELFTQVDRSADRARGGLGIGLTLVKSLVEMHGGRVEARSDGPGRGCEFVVRLPLAGGPRPAAVTGPEDRPPDGLARRRVLVVDDNRDAATSLGMLLRLLGADVHVVYNGADALEALGAYRPSVVLLDIGMPGMDGHEVARRIRERPESRELTLIALTGWGQEGDRRRSQLAGFDHHLTKPADLGALQALLLSLDSRSQRQRVGHSG